MVLVGILVLASAMIYSTARGYTRWYFRVNGQITVDGRATSGYMHANTKRTFLLLTRTDGSRPETYLVSVRDNIMLDSVTDCGNWYPMRTLPFPMGGGDEPPCFLPDPSTVKDAPVGTTLITSRRSIEFSTVSGRKIKAEW